MNRPILTFRSNIAPYNALTSLVFTKTKAFYLGLPVVGGEKSDSQYVRIYNNFLQAAGIANAYNVNVTTYDRSGSFGQSGAVASQHWVSAMQTGYGEGASIPGVFSSFNDEFETIGGSRSMILKRGSDGLNHAVIRAGSDTNNMGFAEIKVNTAVPKNTNANTYTFILSAEFNWTP
jgi:hypothetical protein